MKYRIKQDLPFMKSGTIFGKGCWTGGGWGVDLGVTKHKDGGRSDNGIRVFEQYENALLDSLLDNQEWVEAVPENNRERLELYESGKMTREEFLKAI